MTIGYCDNCYLTSKRLQYSSNPSFSHGRSEDENTHEHKHRCLHGPGIHTKRMAKTNGRLDDLIRPKKLACFRSATPQKGDSVGQNETFFLDTFFWFLNRCGQEHLHTFLLLPHHFFCFCRIIFFLYIHIHGTEIQLLSNCSRLQRATTDINCTALYGVTIRVICSQKDHQKESDLRRALPPKTTVTHTVNECTT